MEDGAVTAERSAEDEEKVHFEEFRFFFESTERVTDRRLELNKVNASIALLITAGIGATLAWSHGKTDVFPLAIIVVSVASFLASVFCLWWWQQLDSYKQLNGAKFEVLEQMAPRLVFPLNDGTTLQSYEPLKKEWDILKERGALRGFRARLALASTLSETSVPVSFLVLHSLIFVLAAIMIFIRRFDLAALKLIGIET